MARTDGPIGIYADREEAGEVLAVHLEGYRDRACTVLAIPNGGVPVGLRVARRLQADFGVLVVRKLHIPWNREAGFGAVAPDGIVVYNEPLRRSLGLSEEEERDVLREELTMIEARTNAYGAAELPPLARRTAILVDDGLASGFSMLAAVRFVRARVPDRIVVAVPTASAHAVALLGNAADAIVCPNVRSGGVFAVADAYRRWRDLEDDEVAALLDAARGGEG